MKRRGIISAPADKSSAACGGAVISPDESAGTRLTGVFAEEVFCEGEISS